MHVHTLSRCMPAWDQEYPAFGEAFHPYQEARMSWFRSVGHSIHIMKYASMRSRMAEAAARAHPIKYLRGWDKECMRPELGRTLSSVCEHEIKNEWGHNWSTPNQMYASMRSRMREATGRAHIIKYMHTGDQERVIREVVHFLSKYMPARDIIRNMWCHS